MENQSTYTAKKPFRVLMSGGGTGGHIFPAVAIADEIRRRYPDSEFLFIGANGKMEMEKVPAAGYKIEGLNIAGFDRGNLMKNLNLPFKLISSVIRANKLIKSFNPDFAVGTGGFASGPALYVASKLGVPIFVQEQNSLPGKTNVFLSKKAKAVFTAYPEMSKFFGGTETVFAGNPIRQQIVSDLEDRRSAKEKLGLNPDRLTILSVGGSLGSRTLNNGWKQNIEKVREKGYQLIWQSGKLDYQALESLSELENMKEQVQLKEFISDMALAYSAADVIVSRAGAIAISELAVAQKPVILVPFPFAAEDHQTKNAQTLVDSNAARMVKDSEMQLKFWNTVTEICDDENLRKEMSENLKFFAKPEAAQDIVSTIFKKLEIIK